jgi:hypothetical protein
MSVYNIVCNVIFDLLKKIHYFNYEEKDMRWEVAPLTYILNYTALIDYILLEYITYSTWNI